MNSNKRGFTLVELMVVVGMLAVLMSSMTFSVNSAREKAKVQKATAEVKVISQAILAYENFAQARGDDLPSLSDAEATASTLNFLLGEGDTTASGQRMPALLQASLKNNTTIVDPWGTPYRVKITEAPLPTPSTGNCQTGFYLPNFYRLSEGER